MTISFFISSDWSKFDIQLLLNISILKSVLEAVVRCPDCCASVELIDRHQSRIGFSYKLNFVCTDCHIGVCSSTLSDNAKIIQTYKIGKCLSKCPSNNLPYVNLDEVMLCAHVTMVLGVNGDWINWKALTTYTRERTFFPIPISNLLNPVLLIYNQTTC